MEDMKLSLVLIRYTAKEIKSRLGKQKFCIETAVNGHVQVYRRYFAILSWLYLCKDTRVSVGQFSDRMEQEKRGE